MKQFNKVRVTLTLDPEIHEYLQKLADQEERSLSQQVNKILKDFIKASEDSK